MKSVLIERWVVFDPSISPNAKGVYLALLAKIKRGVCGCRDIESATGLSDKSIHKAIRELEAVKLIKVKRSHGRKSTYSLTRRKRK